MAPREFAKVQAAVAEMAAADKQRGIKTPTWSRTRT
jgi:hypothetical protein